MNAILLHCRALAFLHGQDFLCIVGVDDLVSDVATIVPLERPLAGWDCLPLGKPQRLSCNRCDPGDVPSIQPSKSMLCDAAQHLNCGLIAMLADSKE
jgi:hypothetical protein